MKNKLAGILGLLFATVIWGFAFTAQTVGMEHIGPFTFQALRCFLAVAFLLPLSFLLECRKHRPRETLLLWLKPELWTAGLCCGCVLFLAASLQQLGLMTVGAGKAGFLTAMYIVMVPILGVFVGKAPGKSAWFSVGLALGGLYLLSYAEVSGIAVGDLYLMGCSLAFAVQIRFIDRFSGTLDGIRLNCAQALVVALLSCPFALLTEHISLTNILPSWPSLLFAGVLSMGVAYSLQIFGQKHLEPTPAALIMSLESVFAALGGWWILGQTMTVWELAGCALVFAAVILSQLPPTRKKTG